MVHTTGSSPRMQGAQLVEVAPAQPGGIIPADAGSTQDPVLGTGAVQDHYRGCGERGAEASHRGQGQGSSPRMRGAQMSMSR